MVKAKGDLMSLAIEKKNKKVTPRGLLNAVYWHTRKPLLLLAAPHEK